MSQETAETPSASEAAQVTRQMPKVAVSILLPAFNEEGNIKRSLETVSRTLSGIGLGYEIVVVDDGSKDGTRLAATKEMEELPVKVVGYGVNKGKGGALKYGTKFASGEIAVFLDCDGEINPLDLVEYLMALRDSDLAIGSKRHPNSRVEAPLERKFLSACFNYMARFLTGVKYSDTQSGLKAFRTSSLKRIMPLVSVKRYAFDVEILTVASLMKMRVVELPVRIQLNARFRARSVLRMLVDLLGIAYRLRINRWYQRNLHNGSAEYSPVLRW
ncbi:MAG: glycosyltransferase family 2 protein [Nitrososphaerota archaeon]|nr:glycosyltransferase family 2 protein [Nitrososphaerota archaeon]